MLYSQSTQAIVQQLDRALRESRRVCYLPSDGHRTIIWKGQSIRIRDGKILLSLSKTFREYYGILDKHFIIQLPSNFNHEIAEVHIVPRHNAKWFEALMFIKSRSPSWYFNLR